MSEDVFDVDGSPVSCITALVIETGVLTLRTRKTFFVLKKNGFNLSIINKPRKNVTIYFTRISKNLYSLELYFFGG